MSLKDFPMVGIAETFYMNVKQGCKNAVISHNLFWNTQSKIYELSSPQQYLTWGAGDLFNVNTVEDCQFITTWT